MDAGKCVHCLTASIDQDAGLCDACISKIRAMWEEQYAPRRLVWTCFESAAAFWAAPWWALTWLLTFGRSGRLPWEWNRDERVDVIFTWNSWTK